MSYRVGNESHETIATVMTASEVFVGGKMTGLTLPCTKHWTRKNPMLVTGFLTGLHRSPARQDLISEHTPQIWKLSPHLRSAQICWSDDVIAV